MSRTERRKESRTERRKESRGRPIRVQIIALIATTQILSTALAVVLIQSLLGSVGVAPRVVAQELTGPFTTLVTAIQDVEPEAADTVIASVLRLDDRFDIVPTPDIVPEEALWQPGRFYLEAVRSADGLNRFNEFAIVRRDFYQYFPLTIANYAVATRLEGNEWLLFTPRAFAPARLFALFVITMVLFLLTLPLSAFLFWATGTLVAPLKRLASAAEGFADDLGAEAAPERGSAEVRTVARAFNRMQARLKAMIDAKSHTLAAIGHDLRTPLTRMRLRLESGQVDTAALTRDVRAMEVMVASALSFIRDGEAELQLQPVDLAALTQTVCDDVADLGHDVTFQRTNRLPVMADPNQMRRALTNVVENGITYGTSVVVSLALDPAGTSAVLRVADNGPGLEEAQHAQALTPFWRGDEARSGEHATGFGLGLSIAKAIMERHGGTIALSANAPNGLVVALSLPRIAPGDHAARLGAVAAPSQGSASSMGPGAPSGASARAPRTATQRSTLQKSK